MKRIFTLGLLLASMGLAAQSPPSVVASEGNTVQAGNLNISYTVGEALVSESLAAGSLNFVIGFQQPWTLTAADSVWPGDANFDLVANNYDVLALGLAYGATGPVRPGATLNWTPQFAFDWPGFLPAGANFKHADTNGDGVVNAQDTLAISQNYGLSHNRDGSTETNGLPLVGAFVDSPLNNGDTAYYEISLGDAAFPAQDVYGVALTLPIDTSIFDPATVQVDFSGWLGTPNSDLLTFTHIRDAGTFLDIALVRNNQQNRNGFGVIARISIVIMVEDLSGKTASLDSVLLEPEQELVISNNNEPIPVTTSGDTLSLNGSTRIGQAAAALPRFTVSPNPAHEQVLIQGPLDDRFELEVSDLSGKVAARISGLRLPFSLETQHLPAGVYQLHLSGEKYVLTQKLVIAH